MKISLNYKILIVSLILLVGNGLLGYTVYKTDQTVLESENWVQHTDEVINQAAKIQVLSKDIETASAGFVITEDRSFIDTLYNAQKTVFVCLLRIRRLTIDNPAQQKRIDTLDTYMKNYLDFSLRTVEKRKRAMGAAMALTSAKQGKPYTDHILQITRAIEQEESRLLIKRKQTNARSLAAFNSITFAILTLIVGLTFLLILFIIKYIQQIKEKEKKSAELVMANKKLFFQNEEKEKRAAELVIANTELFFQNIEKGNRAAELSIANEELSVQNNEKENRAAELVIANEELFFQNKEKEKRANELIIANLELSFQNQEKEKRAAELNTANRLYAFISQINKHIICEKDEAALFEKACSIAHYFGKFKIAWIGLFNDEQNYLNQIAQTGIPNEYRSLFENVPLKPDGPQTRVLQTEKYFICNDVLNDVELDSWRALAVQEQVHSCIILPIKKSAKIIGTLNLYAAEANFFNKEEIELLLEVTCDISFALDMFERGKLLAETQELVVENEKRFHSLIEKSADMITLSKPTGEFVYASSSVTPGLGYSVSELLQLSAFELIHPDDIPGAVENRDMILKTPGQSSSYRQRRKHKNGDWIWCEGSLTNMVDEAGISTLVSNFRDISEKQKAEQQQEFDKNNLDALINNTNDLMWSIDNEYNLITANQPFDETMEGVFGRKILKGENTLPFGYPKEILDSFKNYYDRAFNGEAFTTLNYTAAPFDAWAEISFYPIRKENAVIGVACQLRDVTERVIMEQQLVKSEVFNRGVLNSLVSHVAVMDIQGAIIAVNQQWERFSLQNGEPTLLHTGVGSNYFEVCEKSSVAGETYATKALTGIKAVIDESLPIFYMEYPCDSFDKQRWFGMRVLKFDSDNSLIVISHLDITERKCADQKLIDTSNSYLQTLGDLKKIMHSSLDIICSINREGRFVSLSDAAYGIWGYKPDELMGRRFIDFVLEEDVEKTLAMDLNIISGFPVTVFENRYVKKNGDVVPMMWSANWDGTDKVIYCVAKDITEKKKLEAAFENEKDRFYHFFLNAPSAIGILKGPNHVYEMVNQIYLKLIGKKNITGKTVLEVVPEVEDQGLINILDEVYKTGKPFSANERLVKLDLKGNGVLEDFYLNSSYQVYRSDYGEIEGIFFFSSDVTEQVLARQKIEATEVKYRQIVETAQEGIWLIDKNEKTTFANEKMCEILEYSLDEMIGRTRLSFKDEEASKIGIQPFIAAATTSVNEAYDTQFITKSGRRIWAHVSLNPIYENDAYCGLLAMITDITERKAIEERLAANELRLTVAQDIARIGNFEISLVNATAEWSDQVYNILGVDKNDIFPAASFSKFVHPDDLAAAAEAFHSGRDGALDFRLIGKNGKIVYVSSEWKFELDGEGNRIRLYGIIQDITERKQGEIDRKNLVNDLQLRNTELEQFAYVASHDLQEPLRMVTSFMTQLDKKYSDVIDDKGRKYIHFAVDGAKRMRQIILDLLEFSRVGKTEDDLEEVDFNKLINETLALYRRQIQEVKARVTFKNLPIIRTYKTPLRQVFQNLIGNSLKYRKIGTAPVIDIGFTETKTYFQFFVGDNGIGIAPEYAEKIFIIFQRLHNKDEYSGTGMGLAIVKKIIEGLGGKIWVESTEGKGSTFYFTILKQSADERD